MFSTCPKCQTKLSVEMKHLDEDTAIVCVGCRSVLKIRLAVDIIAESKKQAPSSPKAAVPSNGEISTPELSSKKKVLICIDGEGTRDLVKEILAGSEFKALDITSGKDVLSAIAQQRPAVALIDVGLSDVMGTELCSAVKNDPHLKGTIVILVASIYDKNAKYRRQPDSLFGADDYIERHHIEKELMVKIKKHLEGKKGKEAETPSSFTQNALDAVQAEKTNPPKSGPIAQEASQPGKKLNSLPQTATALKSNETAREGSKEDSKEDEAARRLARIIVSDIVLYNKKKVDDGIRTNTFFDLLKEEIEEGRKHYLSRVSSELQKKRDYYKEAFEEFIKKRKAVSSQPN